MTAEAGIVDQTGRGLGVVAADVDDDGLVDLFVANDTTANFLWHNMGGMKFEETGVSSGVACNADGAFQAGMGTACGDLDGDLAARPVRHQLLRRVDHILPGPRLRHVRRPDGRGRPGRAHPGSCSGFGIALFDANNDGRLDLAIANGHVNDDRPDYPYQMPALLMMGDEHGRLTDATQNAGEPWTVPRVARGLAVGDLDNDGRTDLVLIAQQSPLAYFHNRSDRRPRRQLLRSRGPSPTATPSVRSSLSRPAAALRRAWRSGGGSFLSASDPRLHFGLGDRSDRRGRGPLAVGSSRSVWPSRVRQDLSDP